MAPIPSLLLTSAVHHHLIREKTRTRVGLVVEAGDAREVHHIALLIGYGAAAVNPYLAFETIEDLIDTGALPGRRPPRGGAEVRQGRRQGRAQGDEQDGHLDHRLLHRRAGLRGARPGAGPRRRVLHRHHEPARRHRPRGHRRGGRGAAPQGLPGERHRAGAPQARDRRGVPVAPRGRGAPVQPADGLPAAARDPHPAVRRLPAVHVHRRRAVRARRHAARAVPAAGGRPARRCRSTRSSR